MEISRSSSAPIMDGSRCLSLYARSRAGGGMTLMHATLVRMFREKDLRRARLPAYGVYPISDRDVHIRGSAFNTSQKKLTAPGSSRCMDA
jgi:hypothetical protein